MGQWFPILCGVRQGGVLFPLYAIYIDDLINELRCSGYDVHIGSVFVGSLFCADDIVLLSRLRESVQPLQYFCQLLPMSYLIDQRRMLFWQKMMLSDNIVLFTLSRLILN